METKIEMGKSTMSNISDPKVTVCCVTYNHGKYIRRCLESIFSQKTTFEFEVIIHDDASTDETAEVLLEYKRLYEDQILLILQKNNQYSKGVRILQENILPQAKGKYLAFCEGDDYWIDDHKLQKQFDAMEANQDASWSAHYVQCVEENDEPIEGYTLPPLMKTRSNCIMSSEETLKFMIRNGIQMTSYFVRSSLFEYYWRNPPEFTRIVSADDEAMVRYCAGVGGLVFLNETMSCYRINAIGSWTSTHNADSKKMASHYRGMIRMINAFDDFTDHKYSDVICEDIRDKEWKEALFSQDNRRMMKPKYRDYFRTLPFTSRIKISLLALMGRVLSFSIDQREETKSEK